MIVLGFVLGASLVLNVYLGAKLWRYIQEAISRETSWLTAAAEHKRDVDHLRAELAEVISRLSPEARLAWTAGRLTRDLEDYGLIAKAKEAEGT